MAALDKDAYRRQRAVLLTARALAAEETDRDSAKALRARSQQARADFGAGGGACRRGCSPRAANCAKRTASSTKPGAPIRIPIWRRPLCELRSGDSARDRLKRIEALAKKAPGHIEGALAVARAALDAQEFAKARAALAPYLQAPTKRIALLMAELERAEHNDEGRAREWLARALHAAPDPAWTADGHVSDRWLPASPVTGRLDALRMARAAHRNADRAGDRARTAGSAAGASRD